MIMWSMSSCMCEELCQTSRTESFHVYLVVFIYFVCLFVSHFNTNLHPLYLFRRMLQRCLAVKLRRCFMDEETSQLSLIFWANIFAGCKQVSGPQLENVYSIKHSTTWAVFQRIVAYLVFWWWGWSVVTKQLFSLARSQVAVKAIANETLCICHSHRKFSVVFKMTRDPCS